MKIDAFQVLLRLGETKVQENMQTLGFLIQVNQTRVTEGSGKVSLLKIAVVLIWHS